MKKYCFIFVCVLLLTVCSCLKKFEELALPVMDVSYSENDLIYFSEIQTASVNVKLSCDEDLLGFRMFSTPSRWYLDTIFDNYTHKAEFNLNFSHQKGHVFENADSTYKLIMMGYTEKDSIYAYRTLKYHFEYPEIDSFDVDLSANPGLPCLLDVKNKCAYCYTEYPTHTFDLVFINERRPFYTSVGIAGVSLVSPNAESYLNGYFSELNPLLPPYEEGNLKFRESKVGYVHTKVVNNNLNITADMIGTENGWSQMKIELEGQDLGYAMHDLKRGTIYKCQLSDGSYIVFILIAKVNPNTPEAMVTLRVYYQK